MREIVAAKIGTLMTNDPRTIHDAIKAGAEMQFMERPHMELMASFDLGIRWEVLANGPTLFKVDDDNNVYPPDHIEVSTGE